MGGSGFPGHAERQRLWARRDYHLPTQGNGNPRSKGKKKKRKPAEKPSASLHNITGGFQDSFVLSTTRSGRTLELSQPSAIKGFMEFLDGETRALHYVISR